MSGLWVRFEHMSEGGVGEVERTALDQAREAEVARRRAYFARLLEIAELDRLAVAARTGDRSTERLLQDLWVIDRAEAIRWVAEARDLTPRRSLQGEVLTPRWPCTAGVLEAGRIGPGHVAIIRRTMTRLERVDSVAVADLRDAERILAENATVLPPRALDKLAQALINQLDPDGAAPPEGEDRCDELHLVRRRDGSLTLRGRIHDPLDAEILFEVFDALSTPAGPDDPRSKVCRHAAALKDLAQDALGERGLASDGHHDTTTPQDTPRDKQANGEDRDGNRDRDGVVPAPRRPAPRPGPAREPSPGPGRALLTITIDHQWLRRAVGHGALDSGAVVDVHTLRRWACDAAVVPMILGSRSEPLDVGRLSRTVTDTIRRALTIRDGGCAFPGCTRRPRRCHAHHVHEWIDGGRTSLHNTVLLCRYHHQLIHQGHWTVQILDGLPWFTPPPWVDPEQHRRPGGRRHVPTPAP